MKYDEVRAANPNLILNLYAMTPGGPVTLEIIDTDGTTYTFEGESGKAALDLAFPDPPSADDSKTPDESVFD